MGDPVSILTDVALNVVTGGFYGIAKGVQKTVETGNPSALFSQGLDLGMAATGNTLATDVGGPMAGTAFNAAGGLAGAAGSAGLFAASAPEVGSVASSAAAPSVASTEAGLTPSVASAGEGSAASGVLDVAPSPAGGTPGVGAAWDGAQAASAPDAALAGSESASGGSQGTASLYGNNGVTGQYAQAPGADTLNASDALGSQANNTSSLAHGADALKTMPDNPAAVKGWFESLSPIAQMGLVLAGPQLLTGAAGGLFNGLSAQKKLALETLINQQNQNQRQYLNTNNASAPSISFPKAPKPGLIAAAGG